jgi:Cu+-exporting ATPase
MQVEFDQSMSSPEALVSAVEDAGFDARLLEVNLMTNNGGGGNGNGGGGGPHGGGRQGSQVVRLAVGGMTCAACSGGVERALAAVAGVDKVGVALTQAEAEVVFDGGVATVQQLIDAVEGIGFDAKLLSTAGEIAWGLAGGGQAGRGSLTTLVFSTCCLPPGFITNELTCTLRTHASP